MKMSCIVTIDPLCLDPRTGSIHPQVGTAINLNMCELKDVVICWGLDSRCRTYTKENFVSASIFSLLRIMWIKITFQLNNGYNY